MRTASGLRPQASGPGRPMTFTHRVASRSRSPGLRTSSGAPKASAAAVAAWLARIQAGSLRTSTSSCSSHANSSGLVRRAASSTARTTVTSPRWPTGEPGWRARRHRPHAARWRARSSSSPIAAMAFTCAVVRRRACSTTLTTASPQGPITSHPGSSSHTVTALQRSHRFDGWRRTAPSRSSTRHSRHGHVSASVGSSRTTSPSSPRSSRVTWCPSRRSRAAKSRSASKTTRAPTAGSGTPKKPTPPGADVR
jgi:hypothetical protein